MEKLWAPWRMVYLQIEKPTGCIFCEKPGAGKDRHELVVYRGAEAVILMNLFPYNNGHLMVAPFRHVPSIEELNEAELLELMTLTQESLAALREAYQPEGFNLGVNQGKIAGAGVEDHVHMHVVPRWGADTNYMPVIGDTRVLPQSLDDSFDDITRAFSVAAR